MRKGRISTWLFTMILLPNLTPAQVELMCELTEDPARVELIYTDVHNYLRALDKLKREGDEVEAFQTEYIGKASPGLKEYIRANKYKAENFAEIYRKKSARYENLKGLPKALMNQEDAIRGAFAGMKEIIPDTVFMPVYYFVGLTAGGLYAEPSEYGLLIAISELDADIEFVKNVLVHETVHVQQALTVGMEEYQAIYGPKRSLLAVAIREGAAVFLTYLSTGERTKREDYQYFLENEKRLWKRFESEMHHPELGDWMFQKTEDPEQPQNLGYIMGARIVEAYYQNAEDKAAAVKDILSVTDYREFFEKSGYADRYKK